MRAARSFVVKVTTLDGVTYNVRMYMEVGAEKETFRRLPKEVANGVWANDTTFIPGTAIARVEVIAGAPAEFPDQGVED